MKVLFLDIDGVLNSTRSVLAKIGYLRTDIQLDATAVINEQFSIDGNIPYGPKFTCETIDPVAVGLVRRMLRKDADLRIVLSSTHRLHFCGDRYNGIEFGSKQHMGALDTYLVALGLPRNKLVGLTDVLNIPRGVEVNQWLSRHPEVTHHCAVDDGNDFKDSDCNFVRTNPAIGMDDADYLAICEHLGIHESTIIF